MQVWLLGMYWVSTYIDTKNIPSPNPNPEYLQLFLTIGDSGNATGSNLCAEGYTGVLCATCEEGYGFSTSFYIYANLNMIQHCNTITSIRIFFGY